LKPLLGGNPDAQALNVFDVMEGKLAIQEQRAQSVLHARDGLSR
jgi:hypothetical protein